MCHLVCFSCSPTDVDSINTRQNSRSRLYDETNAKIGLDIIRSFIQLCLSEVHVCSFLSHIVLLTETHDKIGEARHQMTTLHANRCTCHNEVRGCVIWFMFHVLQHMPIQLTHDTTPDRDSTMKRMQKSDWKSDLRLFSYAYRKCMFVHFLSHVVLLTETPDKINEARNQMPTLHANRCTCHNKVCGVSIASCFMFSNSS